MTITDKSASQAEAADFDAIDLDDDDLFDGCDVGFEGLLDDSIVSLDAAKNSNEENKEKLVKIPDPISSSAPILKKRKSIPSPKIVDMQKPSYVTGNDPFKENKGRKRGKKKKKKPTPDGVLTARKPKKRRKSDKSETDKLSEVTNHNVIPNDTCSMNMQVMSPFAANQKSDPPFSIPNYLTSVEMPHINSKHLAASETVVPHFFPFSPLPTSLPSHGEIRGQLPHLDQICYTSGVESPTNPSNGIHVGQEALMDLLLRYVGDSAQKKELPQSSLHLDDLVSMNEFDASSLMRGRAAVIETSRSDLMTELRFLLKVIQRQSDFFSQNLTHINQRCRNTFYGTKFSSNVSDQAISAGVSRDIIKTHFSTASNVALNFNQAAPLETQKIISVKVICTSFKKLDNKPLVAQISLLKHTKTLLAPKNKTEPARPDLVMRKPVLITYGEMAPHDKQNLVAKILQDKERKLKERIKTHHNEKEMSRKKQQQKLEKMEKLPLWTSATMWNWMKESYWADISQKDTQELDIAWEPEFSNREIYWGTFPVPRIITSKMSETKSLVEESPRYRSCSLFDRLQSLLVEVGDEDSVIESDDNENDETEDEYDLINSLESSGGLVNEPFITDEEHDGILDVSELSLDQRTYLQLRAIHLIDQPLQSSSHPVVIEEKISTLDPTFGKNGIDVPYNSIDDLLRRRQIELSDINRETNKTTAFTQNIAKCYISNKVEKRALVEQQNNLISKHDQFAKKRKAMKSEKRTDGWMPW